MTKEQKAIARLNKAKIELRAAQAAVDQMRQDWMIRERKWGVREEAFVREFAAWPIRSAKLLRGMMT